MLMPQVRFATVPVIDAAWSEARKAAVFAVRGPRESSANYLAVPATTFRTWMLVMLLM